MSEIQAANLWFESSKSTGIVGGVTTNTYTIRAGGVDQLIVNSSATVINNFSAPNTFTIGTAAYHVANGNFGIANNTPIDKLRVEGTISTPTSILIGNTTTNVFINSSSVSINNVAVPTLIQMLTYNLALG
jgi:hypothetical protein